MRIKPPAQPQVFPMKGAEQPYRIFVETMSEGAVTLLAGGTIAYSNCRFAEMVRTPLERVTGRSFEEFVSPDRRDRLKALVARGLAGKCGEEFPLLAGDGNVVWTQLSLSPVALEGAPGICLVAGDLTQRRRADELRAYLAAIVDSSDDAVIGRDLAGTFRSWNRGAEKLYGYSAAEMVGQPIARLAPPERACEAAEILARLKRGEVVDHYETEQVRKDGQRIKVSLTVSPIRDREGRIEGFSTISRDVSERHRAEEASRRASAYNRSLIEASLDPLVTIALDGKITDVNSATEKVTGRSREELIGTDFSSYFTDPEKARAGCKQAFREGHVQDYALEIRDGKNIPVLYNASVYRDEAGKVAGVFAAARDISERKRAEEEVRRLTQELEERVRLRTAELETANREMEAFSYSVSHDLRAPLRAISGFTNILLDEYAPHLPPEAQRLFSRVRDNAELMGRLITDLLAFSRLGRQPLSRQAVAPSELVRQALDVLAAERESRKVEISVGELPVCQADAALLQQVFVNLLSNALKYTRARKAARIEIGVSLAGDLPPDAAAPGMDPGAIVYFVRDNGVGFDMRYADKLFGVFQRLHAASDYEGNGVGLATVQRIVHRHGGLVWGIAAVDRGATFYFTLGPCPDPASPPPSAGDQTRCLTAGKEATL